MDKLETPTNEFVFSLLTEGLSPGWATIFDGAGVDRLSAPVDSSPMYKGMSVTAYFPGPQEEIEVHGSILYSTEGEVMIIGTFTPTVYYARFDTLSVTFRAA